MVAVPNEFGRLSLEELDDFEKSNKILLPQDYKDYLLKYNGGKPLKNVLRSPRTVLTYILGMHNGDHYASLYKHIDTFSKRIPFSTLPIAADGFGNLIIMSLHPDNYGQIFFWDHEREPAVQDGHYIDNVSFVAYSFTDLLNGLV